MSHPVFHTASAIKYIKASRETLAVHIWLDQTKEFFADSRHRALRHNAYAVNDLALLPFNQLSSDEIKVAAALHVMEDCFGKIPTPHDFAREIRLVPWMMNKSAPDDILAACVRRCGGRPEDYEPLYQWFKLNPGQNPRLGYLRLHAEGIFDAERVFGVEIETADGLAPTRYAAEAIVKRLCLMPDGSIPSTKDWLKLMRRLSWMNRPLPLDEFFRDRSPEQAVSIVRRELAQANRGRRPIFMNGNVFATDSRGRR